MNSTIFTYPVIIKEIYLDTFGHVNNAMYLTLLEEARWDLLNKGGFGFDKIQEMKIGPTILEIKLRFLKELRLREQIEIQSQMISYDKKVGVLSQKMMRDGEVCCDAEMVVGLFDLNQRKLILLTEAWLNAIGVTL